MAINTSKSVSESNAEETVIKRGKKTPQQMGSELKGEVKSFVEGEQVEVSIPKILAPKLGDPYMIGVNGVTVLVPVDGKKHKVPKAHANRIMEVINNLA